MKIIHIDKDFLGAKESRLEFISQNKEDEEIIKKIYLDFMNWSYHLSQKQKFSANIEKK